MYKILSIAEDSGIASARSNAPLAARTKVHTRSHIPHIICSPPQERLALAILVFLCRIRHMQPLALLDLPDTPLPLLRRLLEEVLVLLKRSSTAFRTVHPTPPASEGVRDAEDKEEPVFQVVEHDGRK
jgi:hypothetical protein